MAFAIKYSPRQIVRGSTYSLHVSIRNKKNELLYINDVHIRVKPTGLERTKLIDVPVILVKSKWRYIVEVLVYFLIFLESAETASKKQWPELVGKTGQEAVKIIKQETGNIRMLHICIKLYLDRFQKCHDSRRRFNNDNGLSYGSCSCYCQWSRHCESSSIYCLKHMFEKRTMK